MAQPVVSLLPERADYPVGLERRGAKRHSASLRVRCCPMPQGATAGHNAADTMPAVPARLRDLSTLGAALVVPFEAKVSSLLEVELISANATVMRSVLARVVHIAPHGPGAWLAGCAFVAELTQEDLHLFQADAVHPAGPECRRWARFPCNVETVCYTSETAPGERRSARVLNISAGGVGLLLRCEFSEGTLLYFEPPGDDVGPAQPLLVRVVRVVEHTPGSWFLGCEFADQINEDDLRDLVE